MDTLIKAAGEALAAGDPLAALKRVALRDDPQALALRGIAMAQLGDLVRARELLRRAARSFETKAVAARARCVVAEAEIALVSRELGGPLRKLDAARAVLLAHGDRANAAHAGYLEARRLLLVGRLDDAGQVLDELDLGALPLPSRTGYWLVAAGMAMRRVQAGKAQAALEAARCAAMEAAIPALAVEVERASRVLDAPAGRLVTQAGERQLGLAEVEELFARDTFVVDACRHAVRAGTVVIALASRPVLFVLVRALAEAWPEDVPREKLVMRAFRIRDADESLRARLRVEMGRLRRMLEPLARLTATSQGFALKPNGMRAVAVLAPPVEETHADLLALLADGQAWSSSALAQALGVSARTVQRALEPLARADRVQSVGHGRARRWMAPNVPGFPTSLLLPVR